MTTPLLAATTTPAPAGWLALSVLLFIAWRLLLVALFPHAPHRPCRGIGKHRSGKYWRDCRGCKGTGRKLRLGRRMWDWITSSETAR